jgi:hypothetical protein
MKRPYKSCDSNLPNISRTEHNSLGYVSRLWNSLLTKGVEIYSKMKFKSNLSASMGFKHREDGSTMAVGEFQAVESNKAISGFHYSTAAASRFQ